MAKIYNEIVIDMNPESPTFEETLYEDSYEYNEGDMMLMQGVEDRPDLVYIDTGDENFGWTSAKWSESTSNYIYTQDYDLTPPPGAKTFESLEAFIGYNKQRKKTESESTEWGAEDISKDDFIKPDGTPKTVQEIYNTLDAKLPGLTGQDLVDYINEALPKYQAVPEEEKGFLETERGFAETEAGFTKQKAEDTYGLTTRAAERGLQSSLGQAQQQASSLGGQMRGAYGGSSMGMRGAIGGQQTLAKGVGSTYGAYEDKMLGAKQALGYAEDAYGLAMDKASFGEEKGEYFLEKGATGGYEAGVAGTIQTDWTTSTEGEAETTEYGSWKRGGRVPTKEETFSHFLTQLPDAGGS